MIEERIIHHLHFMEVQALRGSGHSHRNCVTDEMDVVPPCRKLDAQFSGHNTTTAVCGIACNSNFHEGLRLLPAFACTGCPWQRERATRGENVSCSFLQRPPPTLQFPSRCADHPSVRIR